MAEIIPLPETVYPLTCEDCNNQYFFIVPGGDNPYNIGGFVCADCGSQWELLPMDQIEVTDDS